MLILYRIPLDAPAEVDYGQISVLAMLCCWPPLFQLLTSVFTNTSARGITTTTSFIQSAINRDTRVIFFSSDAVYGEREDAFDEKTACNPAGEYAEMKHVVEQWFAGKASFKAIVIAGRSGRIAIGNTPS